MLLTATGTVLAADTRQLYVGPDPNFAAGQGTLTFTAVSAGGSSLTTVYVKNVDNQTLNHVVLTFVRSQGSVTIEATVLGANASSCAVTDTLITCDFGSLKARASRTFSLILDASAGGDFTVHGTVVFNESTNPNGGNTQINAVDGTLHVGDESCNTLATFIPPGIAKTLDPTTTDGCATDSQHSSLLVPANPNGSLVTLDDSVDATGCATGYSCFGKEVAASVNNGATVTPYLTWTITYSAELLLGINPAKVSFQHDGTVIPWGKKSECGATFTKDCIASITANSDGSYTYVLHTRTNSVMKGLH
jgi:hypothetical protein